MAGGLALALGLAASLVAAAFVLVTWLAWGDAGSSVGDYVVEHAGG